MTWRRGLQGFFVFLGDQGLLVQSPMQLPRHQMLGPTRLPRPMAAAEVVGFFRGIDALEDRTMFLLRRRCGLRVSAVSHVRWAAIAMAPGPLRVHTRKGQVDRVVSLSPDVATALRQGHGLQAAAADEVCPSRMTRKGGLPLGARPIRTRMTRSLPLARITQRSSPHSRRHPFATQRLQAGASREVGKALLGHRSLQMTLRYPPRYDRTKRAQDDPAMAQVEQHQSVHRRSSRDDIRQTALDRLRASLERRQCSAHPVVRSTLARRLCFAEVAVPLAQVSFREVEQCVERQPHLGRAWATINRRRNALQHCFAFGVEPQLVRGNPVKPRHFVRREPPLPQALSREPVQRRFAQIAQPMDRALFLVLLRGGRRVSAVAALTLEQIDGEQQAWHIVQGTGRKARRVSMSPEAVTRVPQCLEQPPGARAQGAVFWNRQRIQQPRSVTALHKKMAREAKAAGITARGHSLRPTFAANRLDHGAEVVAMRAF